MSLFYPKIFVFSSKILWWTVYNSNVLYSPWNLLYKNRKQHLVCQKFLSWCCHPEGKRTVGEATFQQVLVRGTVSPFAADSSWELFNMEMSDLSMVSKLLKCHHICFTAPAWATEIISVSNLISNITDGCINFFCYETINSSSLFPKYTWVDLPGKNNSTLSVIFGDTLWSC